METCTAFSRALIQRTIIFWWYENLELDILSQRVIQNIWIWNEIICFGCSLLLLKFIFFLNYYGVHMLLYQIDAAVGSHKCQSAPSDQSFITPYDNVRGTQIEQCHDNNYMRLSLSRLALSALPSLHCSVCSAIPSKDVEVQNTKCELYCCCHCCCCCADGNRCCWAYHSLSRCSDTIETTAQQKIK